MPGVIIPDKIVERMRRADSKEEALQEGIAIAKEIVQQIRPMVQGVQIGTPSRRYTTILNVMESLEPESHLDSCKMEEL